MNHSTVFRSLRSLGGKQKALHLSWFAFFLTFCVWFDFAPFATTIGHQMHVSKAELATIGICNLGLTVPARLFIGMALDRFGPRRVFPTILLFSFIPNTIFAFSHSFSTLVLSRLALSIVGAGFVVGIRMISEWWPRSEMGAAEGLYGGWGNFGAGAATVGLPVLAAAFGGADGWRWAIFLPGVISALWAIVYLAFARDTPEGLSWAAPKRQGALEVTSRSAVIGAIALNVPAIAILILVAYRIYAVHIISTGVFTGICVAVAIAAGLQAFQVLRVNSTALHQAYPPAQRYPLRSVAVCCTAYAVSFGGELAVLSMLPTFFSKTWHLGAATAGVAAGTFGIMNLVTRPSGGFLSDACRTRRAPLVALFAGCIAAFVAMSFVHGSTPVLLAVVLSILAASFLQGSNGTVFAIAPQIERRVSGQIAGLTGAYGNLGGIILLFLLTYVSSGAFFLVIAGSAAVISLTARIFLPEPVTGRDEHLLSGADVQAISHQDVRTGAKAELVG